MKETEEEDLPRTKGFSGVGLNLVILSITYSATYWQRKS